MAVTKCQYVAPPLASKAIWKKLTEILSVRKKQMKQNAAVHNIIMPQNFNVRSKCSLFLSLHCSNAIVITDAGVDEANS